MNVARVAARVRAGGHDIPPEVIRHRYEAGRKNFIKLYKPLTDSWRIFDNSGLCENLIAKGGQQQPTIILNDEVWRRIHAGYDSSTG
jgi:predicted ABC-type ATPase